MRKGKSYDKEMYWCGTEDQLEVKLKKYFFELGIELGRSVRASKRMHTTAHWRSRAVKANSELCETRQGWVGGWSREANSGRNLMPWEGRWVFPLAAPTHCIPPTSLRMPLHPPGSPPANVPQSQSAAGTRSTLEALLCLKCSCLNEKPVAALLWVLWIPCIVFVFYLLTPYIKTLVHIFWHNFLWKICSTSSYQSALLVSSRSKIIINAKLFLIPVSINTFEYLSSNWTFLHLLYYKYSITFTNFSTKLFVKTILFIFRQRGRKGENH